MARDPDLRMVLTGVKEFKREARKVASSKEVNKSLRTANKDAAEIVAARARSATVPVKSGTLRGAIKAAGTSKESTVRIGGRAAEYAGRIHYGDPGDSPIKGQPFVHEALKDEWDKVYASFEEAIYDLAERLNTGSL